MLAGRPPRAVLDLTIDDVRNYLDSAGMKAGVRKTNVTSFKRFVRFLFDTNRMDNDSAWNLLDFLRHYEH